MAIRYLSQGTMHTLRPDAPEDCPVLFDPRIERGAEDLGERLRAPIANYKAEAWIIRGSTPDFIELLEADPVLPDLAERFQVPVIGLVGSHEEADRGPRLHFPSWLTLEPPEILENELKNAEIMGILEASEAIDRLEHFHYILPSRYHAKEFIRLVDALLDPIDTVRIVDWLLPYLRPDSWVIADTGTLLSLLFALKAEARERFDYDIQVANLPEYPADYVSMDERLGELHGHRATHTLLVVSVSSSGNVAEQFARLGKGDHDVVVICDTGAGGAGDSLSKYPIERWRADEHGKCEMCNSLNQLIVDPRTYQLLPVEGFRSVSFDFVKAAEQEEFWRLADRTDAVRLHFDGNVAAGRSPGRRHMSIDIDITALLKDAAFRQRVITDISGGETPERVLIPDHDAAEAMVALAKAAFPGLEPEQIHRVSGPRLAQSVVEDLSSCELVLLLDDATTTGNTLSSLRREIYERIEQPAKPPKVEAFVVLSRPTSEEDERAVKRPLTRKSAEGRPAEGFRFTERVLLPAFSDCPWCEEREALANLAARIPGQAEFTSERDELLSSMEGLHPPLLPSKADRRERRTHESFIGDLTPEAAFAATASAAQGLTLKLEAMRRGAQIALLDVGLVTEAFYDPIIVAGILRVVPQRFLRHYSRDAEVNDRLAQHAISFGEDCLAEIAWAAIQGKLPREAVHTQLVAVQEPTPAIDAYRALLEAQDPSLGSHDATPPSA